MRHKFPFESLQHIDSFDSGIDPLSPQSFTRRDYAGTFQLEQRIVDSRHAFSDKVGRLANRKNRMPHQQVNKSF